MDWDPFPDHIHSQLNKYAKLGTLQLNSIRAIFFNNIPSRGVPEQLLAAAAWAHPTQGLIFRRNFAEILVFFSFPLVTGKRNFGIFRFEFEKFIKNYKKLKKNDKKTRCFSKQIGLEHTQI